MDDFSEWDGAALVVGGSGGIGRAVVRLLAQRGSDVAFTWRSNEEAAVKLADEAASYGGHVSHHQLETSDAEACQRVVGEVLERHGGLHTLVHAAGPHVPMSHLSLVEPGVMAAQVGEDVAGFFNV